MHTTRCRRLSSSLRTKTASFLVNFSLDKFKERYAAAGSRASIPFGSAEELQAGSREWQRRLLIPKKRQATWLLCCPEDVKPGVRCRHGEEDLCGQCEIPLCRKCWKTMQKRSGSRTIPMSLCSVNFWGYTTHLITKYGVRRIELAIGSP